MDNIVAPVDILAETEPLATKHKGSAALSEKQIAVLGDELKQKLHEAHDLTAQALKVVAFYLAVTGALLKFAFDVNSTRELALALTGMGIFISGVGLGAVWSSSQVRNKTQADILSLQDALMLPVRLQSTMLALRAIERLAIALALIGTISWVYLLGQKW